MYFVWDGWARTINERGHTRLQRSMTHKDRDEVGAGVRRVEVAVAVVIVLVVMG